MASKRKREEKDPSGGDLRVLMVCLNLILLVFFVYINTIGTDDPGRVKKALDSLIGTFSILTGGLNITSGEELRVPGASIAAREYRSTDIALKLREIIKQENIGKGIDIFVEGQDLVITMADMILFPAGSAHLHDNAIGLLEKISSPIKKSSLPVRVEGHTDNRPISTERYPSNWELSTARAVTVLRHLAERFQVPQERLTAVGFGEYQPLVPNDTPEHMARNRRVSIILIGGGKEYGEQE